MARADGARRLGELALPHDPPAFGRIRLAVRRHLRAHGLSGGAVCCGLSGGPDSLALVCGLLAEGARVDAVVVDHGLQDGSAGVAARAAAAARRLGAGARTIAVQVPADGSGTEAAARAARYRALAAAAAERACFLGHTRDDQAETFLLGALRGNPAGMLAVAPNAHGPGLLHRPLLGLPRADTAAACAELGLNPWQDPQNSDDSFRRVGVRRRVLPLLGELTGNPPAATASVAAAADRAAADAAAVGQWASALDNRDVAALAAVPAAVRGRALAELALSAGGRVTAASASAMDALVTDWHGQGAVAVGGGVEVARRGDRLVVQAAG